MPWQAEHVYASSCLQQPTKTQVYLNTTWPQAALYRPIHAKGHLSRLRKAAFLYYVYYVYYL